MPLLMLWLRREARLRWPALLACCLLVAIASATVLTATAGARRGASTVTRLLAVTRPATAEVGPNQPGFDWNRIRALPEVEALTTPEQASAMFNTSQNAGPAGPTVRLRIVGVIRSLWYGDDIGGHGVLIPSPGLVVRYRANFLGTAGDVPLNAIVRLRGGEADLPAFRAELARVSRGSSIDVLDLATLAGHYRSVTGFESACLLAFALAAFLAGLVLAGQAIARLVAASAGELRLATALGLTRGQGTALAAVGPVAASVAGVGAGVALAIGASRWMPFGVAATKEPDPGVTADWLVLGAGLVVFPALTAAVAPPPDG